MNKKNFKSRLSFALPALCALALSSCNRGVGCPTNFSIDENLLLDMVVGVVKYLF